MRLKREQVKRAIFLVRIKFTNQECNLLSTGCPVIFNKELCHSKQKISHFIDNYIDIMKAFFTLCSC